MSQSLDPNLGKITSEDRSCIKKDIFLENLLRWKPASEVDVALEAEAERRRSNPMLVCFRESDARSAVMYPATYVTVNRGSKTPLTASARLKTPPPNNSVVISTLHTFAGALFFFDSSIIAVVSWWVVFPMKHVLSLSSTTATQVL